MPRNKDLKRLVRARMSRTGESYTAARAHVLAKSSSKPRATALRAGESRKTKTSVARAPRPNYAVFAGYSDDVLKARTGCTWERWVVALDYHGADKMTHGEIAALVHEKYKIRRLVVAGGDRRLRAHQGVAGARSAPRRQLRSQQVKDLPRAGGDAVRRVGECARARPMARPRNRHGAHLDGGQVDAAGWQGPQHRRRRFLAEGALEERRFRAAHQAARSGDRGEAEAGTGPSASMRWARC